ncbi:MAG: DUF447 domain-containing protein [Planctomycetota bacterium]
MILESIVTTLNEVDVNATLSDRVNISPMGPRILSRHADGALATFQLRPFDSSRTFANLKRTRQGVLHVDDNVELFAATAIGQLGELPDLYDAERVMGQIIADACRAYEFEVKYIDETGNRMSLNCEVVASHRHRDFFGFNRAKHAVLEAAILATRVNFLPKEEILSSFSRLKTIVEKTAGPTEFNAYELLSKFVKAQYDEQASEKADA